MAKVLGLRQASAKKSFLSILKNQSFTLPVTQEFLQSSSFKLVNPRGHIIATDQVSMRLPISSISGLSDEAVLALFTRGFFAGKVFAIERFILKTGAWRLLPARYTGFKSLPTERIEWNRHKIPPMTFMPVGDVLFGSFKLIDKKIQKISSDHLPSYLDFGFGSDKAPFAGCHRFSIHRSPNSKEKSRLNDVRNTEIVNETEESEVEMRLEHFRCNPRRNVDSWAEYITWFHYWYAKLLFTDGIRSVLRR